MAIYLGATQLDGGGGGGGGSIPNTAIFTSTGAWTVPDSVKDAITNNGYAPISLLAVGGGQDTVGGRAGEVIQTTFHLTSADYDDPSSSSPTVTVVVGAAGGDSGIIEDGVNTFNQNKTYSSALDANTSGGTYNTIVPTGTFATDSNGFILMGGTTYFEGYISNSSNTGVVSANNFNIPPTVTNANSAYNGMRSGRMTAVFADNAPFDGSISWEYKGNNSNVIITHTMTWDVTNQRFDIQHYSNPARGFSAHANLTYSTGTNVLKKARSGASGDFAQFQNDPFSSQGYAGGYSRRGQSSTTSHVATSPGSPQQGGYVQIYY